MASLIHDVKEDAHDPILSEGMAVAEVVNQQGRAPVCLVCEHASGVIPAQLKDLGLSEEDRFSHAALDLGADELARALSVALDAPLVLATVSRLVCDLNRPPGSVEATPDKVEQIVVPGNRGLSEADRIARANAFYYPFHDGIGKVQSGFATPPAFVTVHSFTPTWHGKARDTQIGLLHDADDGLAVAMLANAGGQYRTELNQPYAAKDGVTHTLQRHATGLQNTMIEVRNDLLADPAGVARVAASLTASINAALAEKVRV